ncbi:MAG: VOC family protein [Phycisphaerae bacterium]|nr:VOC family protein [Phycisphaerae bacterium]
MKPIHALVPMAHVHDIHKSIAFYRDMLGFAVRSTVENHGRTVWAALESGLAQLMLAAASGPVAPEDQAVLFYLYSDDVHTLHRELIARGLMDGGRYCGTNPPNSDGRCVVFEPSYPPYMPEGEIRVADPDGYCLLIGQSG